MRTIRAGRVRCPGWRRWLTVVAAGLDQAASGDQPARSLAAITCDAATRTIVMFGGRS